MHCFFTIANPTHGVIVVHLVVADITSNTSRVDFMISYKTMLLSVVWSFNYSFFVKLSGSFL